MLEHGSRGFAQQPWPSDRLRLAQENGGSGSPERFQSVCCTSVGRKPNLAEMLANIRGNRAESSTGSLSGGTWALGGLEGRMAHEVEEVRVAEVARIVRLLGESKPPSSPSASAAPSETVSVELFGARSAALHGDAGEAHSKGKELDLWL